MRHQKQIGTTSLERCRSGLATLSNGLVFPAVQQMREALKSLHDELASGPTGKSLVSEADIVPIQFCPSLVANEKRVSPNNDFCFCLKGFDINANEATDKDAVASVLMYNFAFAMHLYGICTGNSRHLQRALMLYRKTLTLVKPKQEDSRYTHLVLALCANLGHVSSHFLMHEDVKMCREYIRMLLLWHTPRNVLSERDFLFFSGVSLSGVSIDCKNAAVA